MVARLLPQVGRWYAHRDKGQMFQVVAVDEDEGCVETQDFDGDVDEVDLETWFAMPLELAAAPEDWTGPVDDVDEEESGYASTEVSARDWRAPLDELPATPIDLLEADEDEAGPR
jgi:hypothetical protein